MFIKFLEVKGFLEVAWRKVCGWCLPGIKRVSGGYKEGVWRGCLECVISFGTKFFWDQNFFQSPSTQAPSPGGSIPH